MLDVAELQNLQKQVRVVRVDGAINDYILDIVHATRSHADLTLGVSTRGAITLYRAVQSYAFLCHRDYAVPDDVKYLAVPVLAHRVACRGILHEGQREQAREVIKLIVDSTFVPG